MSQETREKVLTVLSTKLHQLNVIKKVWSDWALTGLNIPKNEAVALVNEIGDTEKLMKEVRGG